MDQIKIFTNAGHSNLLDNVEPMANKWLEDMKNKITVIGVVGSMSGSYGSYISIMIHYRDKKEEPSDPIVNIAETVSEGV